MSIAMASMTKANTYEHFIFTASRRQSAFYEREVQGKVRG